MAEKGEQSEMSFLNESRKGSFERDNKKYQSLLMKTIRSPGLQVAHGIQ